MAEGVRFMIGTARFQEIRGAAEPWLAVQRLGPLPIGVVIGVVGAILTFMLLENRKMPAGQMGILFGLALGLALGTHEGWSGFRAGLTLPTFLPDGLPDRMDLGAAILFLVLPQVPMTVGNAVMAYSDLSTDYFGAASRRVTYRSACVSMGLANLFSALVGGMPMCHGAGGLAAHYRFGARTAGSNLIIGGAFVALALFLGEHVLTLFYLLPMSILGVLLFFAGTQLGLTVGDLQTRKDLFVALTILGITLATNLAAGFAVAGFAVGIVAAYALKSERFHV
jgi:SulP family sulfate permease